VGCEAAEEDVAGGVEGVVVFWRRVAERGDEEVGGRWHLVEVQRCGGYFPLVLMFLEFWVVVTAILFGSGDRKLEADVIFS
jgi:hypothetical protein